MQQQSVLLSWLSDKCSWKEQTVVLCALRGPDSGGSPEVKSLVRWIRRVSLKNAAPDKTFMQVSPLESVFELAENKPLVLDMLPVHFLCHLMHAFQVISHRHSDFHIRVIAATAYDDLCDYLHVVPENERLMTIRLQDETSAEDLKKCHVAG